MRSLPATAGRMDRGAAKTGALLQEKSAYSRLDYKQNSKCTLPATRVA